MRRIKFRGRSINYVAANDSYWAYGLLVNDDPPEIECDDGDIYRVNDNTVGQFTGLKDCKGREIYEGDVLECLAIDDGPFVVRVVFRNGAFHTDIHDGVNGANFTCLLADFVALGDVRIVGNIWDGYPKFVSSEGIGGFEK